MRTPNSGRVSNQFNCSLRRTTAPTTITVGGSISACSAFPTISPSVPTTVRWLALVPQRISATGVSAGLPSCRRCSTMAGRFFIPIRKTKVPFAVARRGHSNVVSPLAGSSCPVTNVTVEASVRWVTGIPA